MLMPRPVLSGHIRPREALSHAARQWPPVATTRQWPPVATAVDPLESAWRTPVKRNGYGDSGHEDTRLLLMQKSHRSGVSDTDGTRSISPETPRRMVDRRKPFVAATHSAANRVIPVPPFHFSRELFEQPLFCHTQIPLRTSAHPPASAPTATFRPPRVPGRRTPRGQP